LDTIISLLLSNNTIGLQKSIPIIGGQSMNRIERTIDLHRNGGLSCSQAILTAFGENLGIDQKSAKMLGRPWAGGIGHLALTCGYLTGAVLVLAKVYDNKDEKQARQDIDTAVRELFRHFEERRGTLLCKDLLGANMTTEAGIDRILEEDLVAKHCHGPGGIGQDVAEILEGLI
jgi:C_GCAxxG_C_C family probable redox protein